MQRGSGAVPSSAATDEQSDSAATNEKKPDSKATLLGRLNTDITNIRDTPASYSLAVRIEMIFSLQLLQLLILDAHEEFDEKARQILTFLQIRWDDLCHTAAWNVYSRQSRINKACWTTARCFLGLYPETLALKQITKFEADCEAEERAILEGEVSAETAADDKKIYRFIYKTIFAKQPIRDAWSLLPRIMKDAGSEKETWRILLSNIIAEMPNRLTFIRMLARQVECKDWPYFFSQLTNHGQLFNLILGVDINQLLTVHKSKPIEKQTDNNFKTDLFNAADAAMRERTVTYTWGFIPSYGAEGSMFESHLLQAHGCEDQVEVLALAYATLETYRRVRGGQDMHTSGIGKVASTITAVADKDVKVAGCDILMAFCLQAEQFSKTALEQYIAEKKRDGSLTLEKEKEFRQVIGEGVLKVLFDTLCKISVKVQVLPRFTKR